MGRTVITGALAGIRIVEMAGIGPAPFAAMMLADHGAEVVRIERAGGGGLSGQSSRDPVLRNRRRATVNLKSPEAVARLRALIADADALIEGFRPGVMERLGLGPEVLMADNPRLVYGRMTGWGQTGPLAHTAGHDINYIAIAGNLHGYGRAGEKPTPPINAVGDFGGGGMMLAFGVTAALLSAKNTGKGQVIDCAMTEGAALLHTMMWAFRAQGMWRDERGVNLLDTGAPFYDSYETSDGEYLAIGPIEPQFYAAFRKGLGLEAETALDAQMDPARWPEQKDLIAARIATRTRDEWMAVFEGSDACVAPILSMPEALTHPHGRARGSFIAVDGVDQPAPAPRFSATPAPSPQAPTSLEEMEDMSWSPRPELEAHPAPLAPVPLYEPIAETETTGFTTGLRCSRQAVRGSTSGSKVGSKTSRRDVDA